MTGEMESMVPSALNAGSETGALVEVTFQKTPYKTQKYLEAEPKALGVTQIMLCLLFFGVLGLNWSNFYYYTPVVISAVLFSVLKACLGMQVVTCVFSVITFIIRSSVMVEHSSFYYCWGSLFNDTAQKNMCDRLWSISQHINGIEMLVQVTQIALSGTLAAFCCKVIQCCSPSNNVPVIVVNAPPGPQ